MPMDTESPWNPQQYAEHGRFVSELGLPVVALLAPRPGERLLDLGCGDGVLTRQLHELGCRVVGVDSSPAMIKAAQALGLDARVVDGNALPFTGEFDAVFTNAALHWMTQPDAVLRGVWRALKPGGRFVGECGGYGNIATVIAALEIALAKRGIDIQRINPWFFPSAEEYRSRLEAHGFVVGTMTLFPRPTPLSHDISGWLETFAQAFLAALPAAERAVFLAEVIELCRPILCAAHGHWTADYVRLRFSSTRPAVAGG
jgi:trans-aconitate methyltransferase